MRKKKREKLPACSINKEGKKRKKAGGEIIFASEKQGKKKNGLS